MSADVKLSFSRPLRGLRPHGAPPVPDAERTSGPGEWLFNLRERALAETRRHAAFQTCLEGIDRAVDAMVATVERRIEEMGAQVTELGLALASEVLGAALEQGLADPTPTVIRCLRESVFREGDGEVEVYLAPDDLGPVLDRLDTHPELRERVARVRFSIDPQLERGSVRMETAYGRLVYDPAEVLQRICDEVRRELGP